MPVRRDEYQKDFVVEVATGGEAQLPRLLVKMEGMLST